MRSGARLSSVVSEPRTRVLVEGVQVKAMDVRTQRSILSDLPASVVGGGGFRAATGSVEWAHPDLVHDGRMAPWAAIGWPPRSRSRVNVEADSGTGEFHRIFTGLVDSTSALSDSLPDSELIDAVARLNRRVEFAPMLRMMPPAGFGGAFRGIGLMSEWVVDRTFRLCSYFTTPQFGANPAVTAYMQGSMEPWHGLVLTAGPSSGTFPHAKFVDAPWGFSAHNMNVTYKPIATNTPSAPLQVTLNVAADHAGSCFVDINYTSTTASVRLIIGSSRSAQATYGGTTVATISSSALAGATIVTLLIKGTSWVLKANNGATASGTFSIPDTGPMDYVRINAAEGSRVAGLLVNHPTTAAEEFKALTFTPTARIRKGGIGGYMDALPHISPRSALSLLTEISEATLSPFWIDEDGVMQWAQSDVLRAQPAQITLTSKEHLYSFGWDDSDEHTRSQVDVAWSAPTISNSRYPNVTVWDGPGDTLESQQVWETVISPPSGEDWISVDAALYTLPSSTSSMNAGRGSVSGGILQEDNVAESWAAGITTTMTNIGAAPAYAVKVIAPTLAAGRVIALKTLSEGSGLRKSQQNVNLPQARAYAKVTWEESRYTSPIVGPVDASVFEHQAGPWLQSTSLLNGPQRTGDYLAGQITKRIPEVRSIEVVPDYRVQQGDVVMVEETDSSGVTLKALVVGVNTSAVDGEATMTVDLRTITATPHTTLGDHSALMAGTTLGAHDDSRTGLTLADHASNPTHA